MCSEMEELNFYVVQGMAVDLQIDFIINIPLYLQVNREGSLAK